MANQGFTNPCTKFICIVVLDGVMEYYMNGWHCVSIVTTLPIEVQYFRLPLLSLSHTHTHTHKSKLLSSCWVVDIKKWFKRWDMEDLLKLSSDATKYLVIEERLMDPLRKKWKEKDKIRILHCKHQSWMLVLYKAKKAYWLYSTLPHY